MRVCAREHIVGVDREGRGDCMAGGHVGKVVARYRTDRDAVDYHVSDMVVRVGCDGEGLVGAIANRVVTGRADRAVGISARIHGEGVDREGRGLHRCFGHGAGLEDGALTNLR